MARQFFSGNSIEQAVMAAARHHRVEPDQVAYKLRDKKHGFVNMRKRYVIEVDPSSPILSKDQVQARQEQAPSSSGESLSGNALKRAKTDDSSRGSDDRHGGRSDRSGSDRSDKRRKGSREDRDGREDRGGRGPRNEGRRHQGGGDSSHKRNVDITEYRWEDIEWESMEIEEGISREMAAFEIGIEKILDVMDIDIEYTLAEGETFEIELSGEDERFLIEDDGKVLKAIEHVLPRVVRNLLGKSIPCRADCGGFQAEHEQELMDMANNAAEEVLSSGRSILLDPMTPADRRIVHLALVDNVDIDTSSEGGGYMKRVRVMPIDEE